jgi:drug/metabolite transporter (DMT)-like permease
MPRSLADFAVAAAPALFVVLWSTGFIGVKYGLPYAEPLTFLSARMLAATALLALLAAVLRPPRPGGADIWHAVIAGLLVHGCYLGGVFVAMDRGLPAGIAALIPGLQPVLTSTLANSWLGERVLPQQWAGLALGLVGVLLVVQGRVSGGTHSILAWAAIVVALLGITAGTLYQKRFGGRIDLAAGMPIQYAATALLFGAGAWAFETGTIRWTPEFVLALAWLVVVLSFGAVWLLYFMIRRAAATRVASLFYLTPAVTALMAWVLFDERLDGLSLAGMALCAAGVFLVNRRSERPAAKTAGSGR